MKRIGGFWEGTRAYAEKELSTPVEPALWRKDSSCVTLADLLAPAELAVFTNRRLSIAELLRT